MKSYFNNQLLNLDYHKGIIVLHKLTPLHLIEEIMISTYKVLAHLHFNKDMIKY